MQHKEQWKNLHVIKLLDVFFPQKEYQYDQWSKCIKLRTKDLGNKLLMSMVGSTIFPLVIDSNYQAFFLFSIAFKSLARLPCFFVGPIENGNNCLPSYTILCAQVLDRLKHRYKNAPLWIIIKVLVCLICDKILWPMQRLSTGQFIFNIMFAYCSRENGSAAS